MIARGGGSVINTISIQGLLASNSRPVYGITKAALQSFTRYLARQHGKEGIRCNAVAPGPIVTETYRLNVGEEAHAENLARALTPGLGKPEDIAAAVA